MTGLIFLAMYIEGAVLSARIVGHRVAVVSPRKWPELYPDGYKPNLIDVGVAVVVGAFWVGGLPLFLVMNPVPGIPESAPRQALELFFFGTTATNSKEN